jgi:retron-type reverse transcriptase
MADDEKSALYKQIVAEADPFALLARMRALGFWPEDEPMPEDPPEERAERAALEDELERLRSKGSTLGDPDEALRKERVRRWKESKKKRALAKLERESEREKRHVEWEAQRANAIVHAGDGVSAGLEGKLSSELLLSNQGLPIIHSAEQLAVCMNIPIGELRWLTFHRRSVTLVHYHRYTIAKKTGGERHISAPKKALDRAQRWLLDNVLCKLEPSDDAHGFVSERSIVSNAAPHAGRAVVVNLDLSDFFPTLGFRRVKGLFRAFGYSEAVATTCALLCTEPPRVRAELDGKIYWVSLGERMLPQGACTSPAITNLVCRRLDRRLRGIARHHGFAYTRYADDLTFSSDDTEKIGALLGSVRRIVRAEGFRVNEKKTRVMRRASRQEVTGLTVNARVGISRKERRKLRARLHEAKMRGLPSANRMQHPRFASYLRGMVAYVSMVHREDAERWRRALIDALG